MAPSGNDANDGIDAEFAAIIKQSFPEAAADAAKAAPSAESARLSAHFDDIIRDNYNASQRAPLLHKAAASGDVDTLHAVMEDGGDLNLRDEAGNTPLFYAHNPDVALELLKAGARADVKNDEFQTPRQFMRLEFSQHSADVTASAALIDAAAKIQKAQKITADTWESLWPKDAFLYGSTSELPPPQVLPLFIDAAQKAETALPRDTLFEKDFSIGGQNTGGKTAGAEGLSDCIAASADNIRLWRDHCKEQGAPMTARHWKASGVSEQTGLLNKIADCDLPVLFEREAWEGKPSLKPFFELFDHLPGQMQLSPSVDLQETCKDTVSHWLREGRGTRLTAKEVKAELAEMPASMLPLFPNLARSRRTSGNVGQLEI